MALLLAIDTATSMGSVAIGDGDRVLAELTLGVGTRHSAALLPAIRFALEHAGLEPGQIDGVVVGAGPGSFTGVRIAAATAKALVHATQRPLYAYSTLLALAAAVVPAPPPEDGRRGGALDDGLEAAPAGAPRPVCAVLDARRGEVYAACYRFVAVRDVPSPPHGGAGQGAGQPVDVREARYQVPSPPHGGEGQGEGALTAAGHRVETLMPPAALTIDELAREMAALRPIYVGDGALHHRDRLAGSSIVPPHLSVPRASALLWLAAVQPHEGRVDAPARWQPEYVRASGAERGIRG